MQNPNLDRPEHGMSVEELLNPYLELPEVFAQFCALPSLAERVQLCEELICAKGCDPFSPLEHYRIPKDDHVAMQNRNMAKCQSLLDYHRQALTYVNAAIAHASSSDVLSQCYATRAHIYYAFGGYKYCLRSIADARQHLYFERHTDSDLAAAELDCKRNLDERKRVPHLPARPTHTRYTAKTKEVPHPSMPFLDNRVFLDYDRRRNGRHMRTEREIGAGQVIAIDTILNPALIKDVRHTRCATCHRENNFDLKPCERCCSAMFCPDCYVNAVNTVHTNECGIIDFLLQNGEYRAIFRTLGNTFRSPADVVDFRIFAGCYDFGLFNFWTMNWKNRIYNYPAKLAYTLDTHEHQRSSSEQFYLCRMTAYLMLVMTRRTNLVYQLFNDADDRNFLRDFCHRLLMISAKHLRLQQNCSTIRFDRETQQQTPFAIGLHPILSMIAHDCKANVAVVGHHLDKVVVYTTRPIKADGQLFLDYALGASDEVRHESMTRKYFHHCDCLATDPTERPYLNMLSKIIDISRMEIKTGSTVHLHNRSADAVHRIWRDVAMFLTIYDYDYPCYELYMYRRALERCMERFMGEPILEDFGEETFAQNNRDADEEFIAMHNARPDAVALAMQQQEERERSQRAEAERQLAIRKQRKQRKLALELVQRREASRTPSPSANEEQVDSDEPVPVAGNQFDAVEEGAWIDPDTLLTKKKKKKLKKLQKLVAHEPQPGPSSAPDLPASTPFRPSSAPVLPKGRRNPKSSADSDSDRPHTAPKLLAKNRSNKNRKKGNHNDTQQSSSITEFPSAETCRSNDSVQVLIISHDPEPVASSMPDLESSVEQEAFTDPEELLAPDFPASNVRFDQPIQSHDVNNEPPSRPSTAPNVPERTPFETLIADDDTPPTIPDVVFVKPRRPNEAQSLQLLTIADDPPVVPSSAPDLHSSAEPEPCIDPQRGDEPPSSRPSTADRPHVVPDLVVDEPLPVPSSAPDLQSSVEPEPTNNQTDAMVLDEPRPGPSWAPDFGASNVRIDQQDWTNNEPLARPSTAPDLPRETRYQKQRDDDRPHTSPDVASKKHKTKKRPTIHISPNTYYSSSETTSIEREPYRNKLKNHRIKTIKVEFSSLAHFPHLPNKSPNKAITFSTTSESFAQNVEPTIDATLHPPEAVPCEEDVPSTQTSNVVPIITNTVPPTQAQLYDSGSGTDSAPEMSDYYLPKNEESSSFDDAALDQPTTSVSTPQCGTRSDYDILKNEASSFDDAALDQPTTSVSTQQRGDSITRNDYYIPKNEEGSSFDDAALDQPTTSVSTQQCGDSTRTDSAVETPNALSHQTHEPCKRTQSTESNARQPDALSRTESLLDSPTDSSDYRATQSTDSILQSSEPLAYTNRAFEPLAELSNRQPIRFFTPRRFCSTQLSTSSSSFNSHLNAPTGAPPAPFHTVRPQITYTSDGSIPTDDRNDATSNCPPPSVQINLEPIPSSSYKTAERSTIVIKQNRSPNGDDANISTGGISIEYYFDNIAPYNITTTITQHNASPAQPNPSEAARRTLSVAQSLSFDDSCAAPQSSSVAANDASYRASASCLAPNTPQPRPLWTARDPAATTPRSSHQRPDVVVHTVRRNQQEPPPTQTIAAPLTPPRQSSRPSTAPEARRRATRNNPALGGRDYSTDRRFPSLPNLTLVTRDELLRSFRWTNHRQ